jgi:HAE1 family hydrophobic/amphiphilic exporter-1
MRFAHIFIDRPIFATVLSLILVIVGGIAYTQLPIAQYPEIAPPTIVVRAQYPGADADTVAKTVATPLEQEINGVEDMLYMSSYSTGDGAMALTITFRLGTNLDEAQVLIQNRVSIAEPRLPEEVRRLGVTTAKSSPDLMMVVHMLSPDESYNQLYVSNYARTRVRDILLRLNGVGDLTIFGEREYSLRIWLDPDKLNAYGMTAADVVESLRQQNVQVSGGSIGAPPNEGGNAFQYTVTTQGRFEDARQFRYVIVKSTDEGRLIELQDVARIELGARDYVTNSYLNSKPAVALGIFQRPGTNALIAADEIITNMKRLSEEFPPGLTYQIVYNPTEFIAESINEVYKTIFEAVILVVIVILVFLQSFRSAIVPIVAIPVSLIGTFAFLLAFGFSLNMLTLFGLVLAIGIVVDDAIVVIENVERNIRLGFSPKMAARRTMDEVGGAVVAISIVLIAVFVPTAFIPGISGQFYLQFAVTISVATAISAFNSLTLSPALAGILLKPHDAPRPRFAVTRAVNWLGAGFNRGFDAVANVYARIVRFLVASLLSLIVMLAIFSGLLFATYYALQTVPRGFIPTLDQGYAIVVIQLPAGAHRRGSKARLRYHQGNAGCNRRRRLRRPIGSDLHQRAQCRRRFRPLRFIREPVGKKPSRQRDHRLSVWADASHSGSLHHRHSTASHSRHRQFWRLQIATSGKRKRQRQPRSRCGARDDGRRQPDPRLDRRLHHLLRFEPAVLPRYRPRQGPHAQRIDP